MVYAMNRKAISATAATIFGVVAIIIGMLLFTYMAVGIVRSFQAGSAMAGAYSGESKSVLKAYAVLEMEKSGDTVVNKTYIVFENLVPDEVTVDHIALASKSGAIITEKALNIKLKPGESIQLKPSSIDSSLSVYDNDFWKFKREVAYFEIHVDVGGAGSSFKSYPEYKIEGTPLEIDVETGVQTVTETVTVTSTEIGTYTITPTSTETATTTSTYTSTYVTTPTKTVTTTCTYKTCIQRNYATYYTTVKVTAPVNIIVVKTSYTKLINCYTVGTTTTTYLTSTTTSPKGSIIGTITCGVCGICPTGIYPYQSVGYNPINTFTPYIMAGIIALSLIPTSFSKKRGLSISLIIIISLSLTAGFSNTLAETITVTVTGSPTTTTVTTTITTTSTTTITGAPSTTTTTVTSTVTTTVTSTAPTVTSTVTSTVLQTETRCNLVKSTITITDRPIIVSTSTKYSSTSCPYAWPVYVTETIVSVWSTVTHVYYVDYYRVTCQSTAR